MIALLLAMQVQDGAAAPVPPSAPGVETPAAPPPVVAIPRRVAIDPDAAIALFKAACPANLGDEAAFSAAVAASGIAFTPVARREVTPGLTLRADRALLTYGTGRDGVMRCTLLGRTAGTLDQLSFSARIAIAMALKTGRTRAAKDQAVTEWVVTDPRGRPVQLSAATRNAAGGGTDIRLSAATGR